MRKEREEAERRRAEAERQKQNSQSDQYTSCDVVLEDAGLYLTKVITVLVEDCGFNLYEAQTFIGSTPVTIKEGVSKEEAERLKRIIEAEGATVTLN